MKHLYIAAIMLLTFLTGCSSPTFYNNAPIDAKSYQQNISIVQIENQNPLFEVYKVNSKHYGIRYKRSSSKDDSIIGQINNTIIFNESQLADFKETCQKIIDNYNQKPDSTAEVIEYHLTLNEPEVASNSQATFFSNYLSTSTQIKEFNRVIFRLQFVNTNKKILNFFSSGKEISFMYGNHAGKMSINDLKELLSDLNK